MLSPKDSRQRIHSSSLHLFSVTLVLSLPYPSRSKVLSFYKPLPNALHLYFSFFLFHFREFCASKETPPSPPPIGRDLNTEKTHKFRPASYILAFFTIKLRVLQKDSKTKGTPYVLETTYTMLVGDACELASRPTLSSHASQPFT